MPPLVEANEGILLLFSLSHVTRELEFTLKAGHIDHLREHNRSKKCAHDTRPSVNSSQKLNSGPI